MRAEEVLEIYMRHGSELFPRPWIPPTRFGRAMQAAYQFARELAVYRYNREPLERALRDRFGNRTLGSVNVRLNIPAFDGFNEVNVLKTPHHPDFRLDWQEELVTVALRRQPRQHSSRPTETAPGTLPMAVFGRTTPSWWGWWMP